MKRKQKTILNRFLENLANNTPNGSQFESTKRVNNRKRKKKKVIKEPDTGWSGIV